MDQIIQPGYQKPAQLYDISVFGRTRDKAWTLFNAMDVLLDGIPLSGTTWNVRQFKRIGGATDGPEFISAIHQISSTFEAAGVFRS